MVIETKYNCASLCKTPLFYMSLSVEEGRPETDCTTAILNAMSESL
jgi:hypothetical protein